MRLASSSPRRQSLRFTPLEDRCVPATLSVDSDGGRPFTSIAAAVAAAAPNDTIKVYAGTYTEVVNVPAAKPGLTLKAAEPGVVLRSPADVDPNSVGGFNLGEALIDVRADRTTVSGFTVDGSTNTDGDLFAGIRVLARSATVKSNTVTGLTTASDVQFGIGIQIGTRRGGGIAGTAKVTGNTVADYVGAGIIVDGAGSAAQVLHNTVVGRGAGNGDLAQYGIQVSFGAAGWVEGNTVRDHTAAGNSGGIFFYQAAPRATSRDLPAPGGRPATGPGWETTALNNDLATNEIGVWLFDTDASSGGPPRVANNTVTGSGFAGIYLDESDGVTVSGNTVRESAVNGIAVVLSTDIRVVNNVAVDNGSDGIYLFATTDPEVPQPPGGGTRNARPAPIRNVVEGNRAERNGDNGIFLEEASATRVAGNKVRQNGLSGIRVLGGSDNALSANDVCQNEADGITLEDTTGTVVVGNRVKANTGYGVRLANADGTLISRNRFKNNGVAPLFVDPDSTGVVIGGNSSDDPIDDGP